MIGSKGHALAAACVEWEDEIPYLGDFDVVVAFVPGYKGPDTSQEVQRLRTLRARFRDVLEANTWLICICAPPSENSEIEIIGRSGFPVAQNYLWCPVILSPTAVNGTQVVAIPGYGEYFNQVKSWQYYFELNAWRSYGYWTVELAEIALKNKAEKLLGFSLAPRHGARRLNPIWLYPPTNPPERGINILLEQMVGHKPKGRITLPPWAIQLRLSGETDLEQQTSELNEELEVAQGKLDTYRYLKALLTEQGENLEELVETAFELLGMHLVRPSRPSAGKREDFVFEEGDYRIPIEVRGHRKGMEEKDLNQLISRLVERSTPSAFTCRGILVGNPFLEQEPDKRRAPFETSLIEKAKPFNISLLGSTQLLNTVVKILQGQDIAARFKSELLMTAGVVESP